MQLIENTSVVLLLRDHLTLKVRDLFEQQRRRNGGRSVIVNSWQMGFDHASK